MTHRALIVAAMTGDGAIGNPLWSEDTRATRDALQEMGAEIEGRDLVRVTGRLEAPAGTLDCANSGTTLRLLTGVAATLEGETRLDGDASLRKRPMGPLVEALSDLGTLAEGETAPVTVVGPLVGGSCRVPGDVSSQFVSALILAGTASRDGVRIAVDGDLVSRPYVDLTVDMVEDAGGQVSTTTTGWAVEAADLSSVRFHVEGDWSSAAFPLALGALSGPVTVEGLETETRQGDRAIADHLEALGADVRTGDRSVTVEGGDLAGTDLDLADTPDLFPVLAAVACHAEGETRLTGAAHLRAKESDRIAAMVQGIDALGGTAEPLEDGAVIEGGGLAGGKADTHGDHRILMALAVAATRADGPVTLSEHRSHAVSYPSFLDDLTELDVRWET